MQVFLIVRFPSVQSVGMNGEELIVYPDDKNHYQHDRGNANVLRERDRR